MVAAADEAGLSGNGPPLVSIVVRSIGRPEVAGALACLAAQDYPALDVIVIDATGGRHPPLPELDWRDGRRVRLVAGTRRLNRTEAANAGLDAVRGEYFGYLDDDDACEPAHVSALVRGAQAHPDALAVYGRAQWLRPDGSLERLHGLPFNRMLLFHGPIMCWQAALFRREVIALGCRFRAEVDRMEDRDFVAQVAARGELALIDAATFRFRPDLGSSGTGTGANVDHARRALLDLRLRDFWYGGGVFHTARAVHYSARAARALGAGRIDDARRILEDACVAYPEDPSALDGLAHVALAAGDLDRAEAYAARALAVHDVPAFRATLAAVRARRGAQAGEPAAPVRRSQGRLEPCACGSGRRHKDCCGRLATPAPGTTDPGTPAGAMPDADPGPAAFVRQAATALEGGDAALALELAARALGTAEDRAARQVFEEAGARVGRDLREASMRDFTRALLVRRGPPVDAVSASTHVVGDFRAGHPDRDAARAITHEPRWANARWWTVAGPAAPIDGVPAIGDLDATPPADRFEHGALLLLAGATPPGDWLDDASAAAVVVHHDGDLEPLLTRLAQVDCARPDVALDAWPAP